jgi:CheY-like chemotaxis protein
LRGAVWRPGGRTDGLYPDAEAGYPLTSHGPPDRLTFRSARASLLPMPTILVVDDEPGIRRALRRLIEKRGWQVTEAGTADEGLEVVGKGGIDGVVCDFRMPGGSGIAFYDRAIKVLPTIKGKVVFLTAAAQDEEVLRQVESRGAPLLSKLYELDLAVDAVAVAVLTQ